MKDLFPLFIFAAIIFILMFVGIRASVKKGMQQIPTYQNTQSMKDREKQQQRVDELREQQKKLAREQKQRLRDLKRRY